MSTVWRGICLSHNPPIEFEVSDGSGYDIRHSSVAAGLFRAGGTGHDECDVVIGGYSYPLVAVVCPCGHNTPREYGIQDLRLVQAAARAGVGFDVADWLRHNNCWTLERLAKVLDNATKDEGTTGS